MITISFSGWIVIPKSFSASEFAVPLAWITVPPLAPNSFAASMTASPKPEFTTHIIA